MCNILLCTKIRYISSNAPGISEFKRRPADHMPLFKKSDESFSFWKSSLAFPLVSLFILNFDCNQLIEPQFCTCHGSWVVGACAKLWHDWIAIVRKRDATCFVKPGLSAHKPFIKWVPGLKCYCCHRLMAIISSPHGRLVYFKRIAFYDVFFW